jgi:hypothetical protein
MQYILTEEEYKELSKRWKELDDKFKSKLQEFCTRVSNEMLIKHPWDKTSPDITWGCILTGDNGEFGVCDECPSVNVCPNEHKEFSK